MPARDARLFLGAVAAFILIASVASAADSKLGFQAAGPLRYSGSPAGVFRPDVTQVTVSLTTDEPATCRYSAGPGVPYSSMTETFSTSNGFFHTRAVSGLASGQSYYYYVRCQDMMGNANTDDYLVSFSIGALESMLNNGDFEEGFTGGRANSWSVASGGTSYTPSQSTGYGGTGSSQRIDITSVSGWGFYFAQTQSMGFSYGSTYNWSFWYKTGSGGSLSAQITDPTWSCPLFLEDLPPTNGVWVHKDLAFTHTQNPVCAMQLRFYSNSVGTYWVDQVILTEYGAFQPTPPTMDDCAFAPAENRVVVVFNAGIVSSVTEDDAMVQQAVSLPSGHYRVSLMSYDGYPQRVSVNQPNEKYFIKFYDGAVQVSQSSSLPDLQDNVASANQIAIVNDDLYLGQYIDKVVAYHSVYPDTSSANSLHPICAAFDILGVAHPSPPSLPGLVEIPASDIHLQTGESYLARVYVRNPDSAHATISLWLGGDYPAGLAKFSELPGIGFTTDMRNATFGLNPQEEKSLHIFINSAEPVAGGYVLSLCSNTTARTSFVECDYMRVSVDITPSFPGPDALAFFLTALLAGSVFWMSKEAPHPAGE